MKILRISSIPVKQEKSISNSFQKLIDPTYEVALKEYFNKFLAVSDAFIFELNKTGKCIAKEVVVNHTELQLLWQNEFGEGKPDTNILKNQIEEFKPDVIFVNTNLVAEADLRLWTKNKPFIFAWDGFIIPEFRLNSKYDLVLTCLDSIADKYHKIGTKSEVLDFAFDYRILEYVETSKNEILNFVGNISFVHRERQALLTEILNNKIELSLYLGNFSIGKNPLSRTVLREIIQNKRPDKAFESYKLQLHNKGVKYGLDMYQTMAHANSTLNFHGDEVDKACNMRLFEATGLGTCLVTDNKLGLDKFFVADKEVVVFNDKNDLIEKVKFLQNNPAKALEIGEAGKKKVFSKHLWSHRVIELLEIINRNI